MLVTEGGKKVGNIYSRPLITLMAKSDLTCQLVVSLCGSIVHANHSRILVDTSPIIAFRLSAGDDGAPRPVREVLELFSRQDFCGELGDTPSRQVYWRLLMPPPHNTQH